MSNFIILIDSEKGRRERFAEKAKDIMALSGLHLNQCRSGEYLSLWTSSRNTPVSSICDEEGAALLLGDAIEPGSEKRMTAEEIRKCWESDRRASFFDGYYAAVAYNFSSAGLAAGADLLGMFPVYYSYFSEILILGSSPELFRCHPSFRMDFNPSGLVGILLTMHLTCGETLLKGVKRLSAGHLLRWRKGQQPVEEKQHEFLVSQKHFSLPFSAHLGLIDRAISRTLRRHVQADVTPLLLLSGGLDSRMIAGYLSEAGCRLEALTLGLASDDEARCAKKVAQSLSLDHRVIDVPYSCYRAAAERRSNWEHLSSGFNELIEWALPADAAGVSNRIVMGHAFDAVVGTRYINWAYEPEEERMSFGSYFRNINRYGLSPGILKKLLNPSVFEGLVEDTIQKLRSEYESYSDLDSQRAWSFNLYNRQRFHVGNGSWPISFQSWPVIPALDYELLTCAGGMPASTIAERRAQVALFAERFPALAALPLDRNSSSCHPLRPRLRQQLLKAVRAKLRISGNGKVDRRYYARVYDINNPGWYEVRREADKYRERLYDLMDREVMQDILPSCDESIRLADPIVEASGRKLLLGLMLWSRDHM
jgi:asparagine synthase (glutamine-hydrolysing)